MSDIDTEMYLRDGAPRATVCRVVTKDGRVGIGIFRQFEGPMARQQPECDELAKLDALDNLPPVPRDCCPGCGTTEADDEPSFDLQRGLCTKCHINPPNHRAGQDQRLCCGCYVRAGFAPADWHPECMRVYAELKEVEPDNDMQASLGFPAK